MTYLEVDIICSKLFLSLRYSPYPMIVSFILFQLFIYFFFDLPGI